MRAKRTPGFCSGIDAMPRLGTLRTKKRSFPSSSDIDKASVRWAGIEPFMKQEWIGTQLHMAKSPPELMFDCVGA